MTLIAVRFLPSWKRTFPPHEDSVVLARNLIAAALNDWDSDSIEIAMLLVSELATNSVVHARSRFDLSVHWEESGNKIRVAVTDFGGREPRLTTPSAHVVGGRGLHLVKSMAENWGIDGTALPGSTTVWFELRKLPSMRK